MQLTQKHKTELLKWYNGKTVLVTGATSGIGLEFVNLLTSLGAKVIACGRNKEVLSQLHDTCETFEVDLSDEQGRARFIETLKAQKDVQVLINNAGFGHMGFFERMDYSQIQSMQNVNMKALVELTYALLPQIKQNGGGVLNVGSVASFFPTPLSALYSATKFFVLSFTDSLHQELLKDGIHVSGLYPGLTKTQFLQRATNQRFNKYHQAMQADQVALEGLAGLAANQTRVIPGFGNRLKVFIAQHMPPPMFRGIMYKNNQRFVE